MADILVINPGSTSTKIALYRDEKEVFTKSVPHPQEELSAFETAIDQLDYRTAAVERVMAEQNVDKSKLSLIMARGGMLPPLCSGAFDINDDMKAFVRAQTVILHISNVACLVADRIAGELNIPAYVYDPVSVDELMPIARITGYPGLEKRSVGHVLNSRAVAKRAAENMGKKLEDCTFIVGNLGGGTSTWLMHKGKLIDMFTDDDANMGMERGGGAQITHFAAKFFTGEYTLKQITKMVRGGSGLKAHLGTSDAREVEKMILNGDKNAELIYHAVAYQMGQTMARLAATVSGKVDKIILTGGMAHSKMLADWVGEYVSWIAPYEVMAGEFEMEALALGGLRVLRGEEPLHQFTWQK